MFGLEKKEKVEAETFDLEKEIRDAATYKKLKERVENRIQTLKAALRSGESKEEFDQFGVLLHAYAAVQKLMARVAAK
jgi:Family of unknown function (DUF5398)